MEKSINITHEATSYINRIKYHILILIGVTSFCGIVSFVSGKPENIGVLLISLGIIFSILTVNKILKTRLYLADFISDSDSVKIVYFDRSRQLSVAVKIEDVEVYLKNMTSRYGLNFELIVFVNEMKFTIDRNHDWIFTEMKNVFEYVRFHNNIPLSEMEKHLLERIEEHIKKVPF